MLLLKTGNLISIRGRERQEEQQGRRVSVSSEYESELVPQIDPSVAQPVFTIREKAPTRCLNSVLNVKALVGAFNQEKALVGAFSLLRDCTTSPINRLLH